MTTKRPIPPALAKNASKLAKAAEGRHAARARSLLASIADRRRDIAGAFWDIGRDLVELKEPKLFVAVGHASFESLVVAEAGFSVDTADKLCAIALHYPREQAVALGQEKAAAVLALAEARGDASAASTLAQARIALPGRHQRVRPAELSANELKRAARDVRTARRKGPRTTAAETRAVSVLVDALSAIPSVKAHATHGAASKITVSFSIDAREAVARAILGRRATAKPRLPQASEPTPRRRSAPAKR